MSESDMLGQENTIDLHIVVTAIQIAGKMSKFESLSEYTLVDAHL